MRKIAAGLIVALLFAFCSAAFAGAAPASRIVWGEAQSAVYDPLLDTILAYNDELSQGGIVLSTLKITTKAKDADFVINRYGDMAANGIVELGGKLEEPTPSDIGGFVGSVKVKQNGVYLIVLHDGSFAKVRIDRLLPAKAMFSYVLAEAVEEAAKPKPVPGTAGPGGSTDDGIPVREYEEGAVKITVKPSPGDAGWDIYRSDNGAGYVKLNDFRLDKPEFIDNYALAGHVYLYKFVIFDSRGQKKSETGPIKLKVIPKSGKPDPAAGVKIVLQVDNKKAEVNGEPVTLEVPPTLIDGRTMVPLRFIAEALGAELGWDGDEYRITLRLNGDEIVLWIDRSEALLNGDTVYMDVPAMIVGGKTLVPVRFVSENLKQQLDFDNDTRIITITSGTGESPEPSKPAPKPEKPATSSLFGAFYLRVPGAVVDGRGTPGAESGGIVVNADGTYIWYSTYDGEEIHGVWEQTGDGGFPIRILDGEGRKDWALGPGTETTGGDIILWDGSIWKIGTAAN